jgi:hypothetical protein
MQDAAAYFARGTTAASTDSRFLLSTSSFLNDPRLRDWVAAVYFVMSAQILSLIPSRRRRTSYVPS